MGEVVYMTTHARQGFAQRLCLLRKTIGYENAADFAKALGVRPGTYGRWERAETEPSINMILRICQRLAVTPTFLLLGHNQEAANLMAAQLPAPKEPRKAPRRVTTIRKKNNS